MIDLANKHWTTPAEINIKNHKWATKYYREFGRRIKNQEIWKYVLPRIAADRERLRMAKSPEEQIAILREQKSIEQYIEEAYELLVQQAYYATQLGTLSLRRVIGLLP